MEKLTTHAVILAGGRGTRWRLSRLLSGAAQPHRLLNTLEPRRFYAD